MMVQYEFNPFTGNFDMISTNFSYNYIPESCCAYIPENQQMIVHDKITIDGTLTIDGQIVIME